MNRPNDLKAPTFDSLLQSFTADLGASIPAVIWRADLVKNEITFLNDHVIPGLEDGITSLLQDPSGAERILADEDLSVFIRFQEHLRQRRPVSEVFRARGRDGFMRWLYIFGTPDPELTFCYLGMLADCTGLANGILKRGSETSLSDHVALFSNPVFMVDVGSHRIVAANRAAQATLGIDPDSDGTDFAAFLAGNSDAYLRDIYERLLFDRSWNGLLSFRAADHSTLNCLARVRAYDRDGNNLLWFSLIPRLPEREERVAVPAEIDPAIDRKLAGAKTLRDLLRVLLESQPGKARADAAMLSQIFISEGHVIVTGVGEPFEKLAENKHPYQGSIAENIVLYDLDQVIVEDTAKSIKPIDWALFIPLGIRSYFAVPCFRDSILRDVVIFCSTSPNAFSEEDLGPYRDLAESMWEHLPRFVGDLSDQHRVDR